MSFPGSHLDGTHERVVAVLQELRAEVSEEEPHIEGRTAMNGQLPGSLATLRHPAGLLPQIGTVVSELSVWVAASEQVLTTPPLAAL